jgi:hypothetical protein
MIDQPAVAATLRAVCSLALVGGLVFVDLCMSRAAGEAQTRQQYLHDNSPYCQNSPGLPLRPGPQGWAWTGNQSTTTGGCLAQAPPPQRPPIRGGVSVDDWCRIWNDKLFQYYKDESARVMRIYDEEMIRYQANRIPGVDSYPPPKPSRYCDFVVSIISDGSVTQATGGGESCGFLRNRIVQTKMPPFPSSTTLQSITVRPQYRLNSGGRPFQTDSPECKAAFGG